MTTAPRPQGTAHSTRTAHCTKKLSGGRVTIKIRFNPELWASVCRAADSDGISAAAWIRRALSRYLESGAPLPVDSGQYLGGQRETHAANISLSTAIHNAVDAQARAARVHRAVLIRGAAEAALARRPTPG